LLLQLLFALVKHLQADKDKTEAQFASLGFRNFLEATAWLETEAPGAVSSGLVVDVHMAFAHVQMTRSCKGQT